jgi:hypothetical protein
VGRAARVRRPAARPTGDTPVKRILVVAMLAAALGCVSTSDVGRNGAVQVSFATSAAPGTALTHVTLGANQNDTVVIGTDTIVFTEVKLVLREIEMKRVNTPACTGGDECEKFETGPVLVTLPLTPGAQQQFVLTDVPAASYNEIEFEIHEPDDDDPNDQAFIATNPDFENISIRVRGTYNGIAFEFRTDLDVEQELALSPPLVVADGTSTNVTIFVDVSTWFVVGGVLVDPSDPGVADQIEDNIENSIEAFEDPDGSGSDDDDDDDD